MFARVTLTIADTRSSGSAMWFSQCVVEFYVQVRDHKAQNCMATIGHSLTGRCATHHQLAAFVLRLEVDVFPQSVVYELNAHRKW